MRKLIPDFILQKQAANEPSGSLTAAVIFIDIAGFTAMTSSLMQNGKEGAEVVSAVINNVFTPAIDLIHQNCGFIATFAGDAFTAIFPENKAGKIALNAGLAADGIIKLFEKLGCQQTRFGDYDLSVKIGLSYNLVNYQLVKGNQQIAYYLNGGGVDGAAECEHFATKLEIVADLDILARFTTEEINYTAINQKFFKINSINYTKSKCFELKKYLDYKTLADACLFMPETICNMHSRGEFREIISCFISFLEVSNLPNKLAIVMNLCNSYGGYFNKIDFGDKGGVILVLFGAPVTHEKLFNRATDFAYELLSIPGFTARIGMSFGTAFTGFVGSLEREEYTALGETVNLASRFMMMAEDSTILADTRIANECHCFYNTKNLGLQSFKGFSEQIPIFSLLDKKRSNHTEEDVANSFIGREEERDLIKSSVELFYKTKKSSTLIIEGLPGIGKSRLAYNIQSSYLQESDPKLNWFVLPSDEILKKSYNPLIHFLSEYLELDNLDNSDNPAVVLDESFDKFSSLISDSDLHNQIKRQQPVLTSLLGIRLPDSFFNNLEAKEKNQRIKQALSLFFSSLASVKPLILQIEDAHWLDHETNDWLTQFYKEAKHPVMLIVTTRLHDDGSSLNLFSNFANRSTITLNSFKPEELRQMILTKLHSSGLKIKTISHELFNYIQDKSDGNPFYSSQIVLYLLENNLIGTNGRINGQISAIPTSINAIILARIDRLSEEVRETIKTASVLGREFSVEILTAMLKNIEINNTLKTAEQEVIWNHLSEIKYIFHHALIRESIYEMQLKEHLRKLHKLAAETIERLFANDLKKYWDDLADHYYKAERHFKAKEYLMLAAIDAENYFRNRNALEFYDKLISIYEAHDKCFDDLYLHSLIHSGVINYTISEVAKAEEFYQKAINIATTQNNPKRLSEVKRYLGNICLDRGELQEAFDLYEECETISKSIDDYEGLCSITGNIGIIYFTIGDNENALKRFQEMRAIGISHSLISGIAKAYNYLGTLALSTGETDQAEIYYKNQYNLACDNLLILPQMASLGELGRIYYGQLNYKKAGKYFRQQLIIAQKTDSKFYEATALKDLGTVFFQQGNYKKALQLLNQSHAVFTSLQYNKDLIMVNGNIGDVYFETGNYLEAEKYYQQQFDLAVVLQNKSNQADASGNLGNICLVKNDYKKAIEYFKNKKQIGKKINDPSQYIDGTMLLVNVYLAQEKYTLSRKSLLSIIKYAEKHGQKESLLRANLNLAHLLCKIELFVEANDLLEEIETKFNDSKTDNTIISLNLTKADALVGLKQFEIAEQNYLQAEEIARKIGFKYFLTTILNHLAELYFKTDKLDQAIKLNQEALAIAQEVKLLDDIFAAEFLQAQMLFITNQSDAMILLKKMQANYPKPREQSRILWILAKITNDNKVKNRAIKMLNRQIRKTNNPEYLNMLNLLA